MAIKFEKIVAGMRLYDRHKHRMGNTTINTIGEWDVKVIEVHAAERCATVSWNGNRPEQWFEGALKSLSTWSMYDDDVVVERGIWDCVTRVRKMTKAEKAAREGEV